MAVYNEQGVGSGLEDHLFQNLYCILSCIKGVGRRAAYGLAGVEDALVQSGGRCLIAEGTRRAKCEQLYAKERSSDLNSSAAHEMSVSAADK